VTSLTISRESEKFLNAMIARENLPCDVVNCHLYEYEPGMKYDAIVNLGVTEHLPDYGRSIATYQRLLKPGGKMYLDASACREKYKFHSFIYRYIYPNNCSPAVIHDWLTHLARTPFQLRGVWDDRWNYYLTARYWAEKFERNRDKIVGLEGEVLFRQFQIYLWGTADVFKRDIMQAYRWVIQLPE
jgi:cyclopropane-fatty-acyl-phospholipid synthase